MAFVIPYAVPCYIIMYKFMCHQVAKHILRKVVAIREFDLLPFDRMFSLFVPVVLKSSLNIQLVHKSIFGCGKCTVEIHPVTFTEHSWHGVVVCYHILYNINYAYFAIYWVNVGGRVVIFGWCVGGFGERV